MRRMFRFHKFTQDPGLAAAPSWEPAPCSSKPTSLLHRWLYEGHHPRCTLHSLAAEARSAHAWEAAAHQQYAPVADDDLVVDVGRAQQARLTHRAVAPDRRVRRQPRRRSPAQASLCQAIVSWLLVGYPSCNAQTAARVQHLWYRRVVGGQCEVVLIGRTLCTRAPVFPASQPPMCTQLLCNARDFAKRHLSAAHLAACMTVLS